MHSVAPPPMRFELVGFTAATYTGDMGGNFGVTQKCQLEVSDCRTCTIPEVIRTTALFTGLSGDVWVQPSGRTASGFYAACRQWTTRAPRAGR